MNLKWIPPYFPQQYMHTCSILDFTDFTYPSPQKSGADGTSGKVPPPESISIDSPEVDYVRRGSSFALERSAVEGTPLKSSAAVAAKKKMKSSSSAREGLLRPILFIRDMVKNHYSCPLFLMKYVPFVVCPYWLSLIEVSLIKHTGCISERETCGRQLSLVGADNFKLVPLSTNGL